MGQPVASHHATRRRTPDPYIRLQRQIPAERRQSRERNRDTYTANGKLASKTDAKGQQIVYTYDAYIRLTQIQRYPTPGNEDVGQRTTFVYDSGSFSQNSLGRLAAVQYSAGYYAMSEQYSYTPAGLMTGKRLAVTANVAPGTPRTVNMDTFQTYDNEGKVLTVTYPDSKTTSTPTTPWDVRSR